MLADEIVSAARARCPGHRIKSQFLLALMLCVLALQGCDIRKPSVDKRLQALDTVVRTYRKLMRWGYYEQAAQYLKARDESDLSPNLEHLSHFKVTGFYVGERLATDAAMEARVLAQIQYYDIDSGVAESYRDDQFWWYDETEKRWYLGTPMPNFGAPRSAKPTASSRDHK